MSPERILALAALALLAGVAALAWRARQIDADIERARGLLRERHLRAELRRRGTYPPDDVQ